MYKLTFLLFFPCIASAALPPAWQGVAELKAILNAPELPEYLESGDVIQGVLREENGWRIETNHRSITIEVIPKDQKMPGPKSFELKFKKQFS